MAMQHQKEPYEFQFIPEVSQAALMGAPLTKTHLCLLQISKVLLHHKTPGNEDDLYMKVDDMEKNGELQPVSSS